MTEKFNPVDLLYSTTTSQRSTLGSMNGYTWNLNMSVVLCYTVIFLLFSVRQAEPGKLPQPDPNYTQLQRGRIPGCKEIAFKLETFFSDLAHGTDCTRLCTSKFRNLIKSIDLGTDGRIVRPTLNTALAQNTVVKFLDDCMYHGYHCLTQLSAEQLSDPELIDEPFFWDRKFSAAISLSKGLKVCHCGLNLKLFRVSRKDVTVFKAEKKTNCSNVEICKRLSTKLPHWPCVAETTIQKAVACIYASKSEGYKSTKFCRACNSGIHATDKCRPVDWSGAARGTSKPDRSNDLTIEDLQADNGIREIHRLFGNLDDYHVPQMQMNQAASASPSAAIVNQHQSNGFAQSSQPFPNLLTSSSFIPDEYPPVPMESSDIFPSVEPTSIAHQAAELTSIEGNGKRARLDIDPEDEFVNSLDLYELRSQYGKWERGESSRSVGDRASSGRFTHGRGEVRYTYDNQNPHAYVSSNQLSTGFPMTQGGAQQWSGNSGANSQTIQLDGSWSDILHQLGPEPQVLPDLASLGNSQINAVSNSGIDPQQPDFNDLVDGGDPPVPDDNEFRIYYDGLP